MAIEVHPFKTFCPRDMKYLLLGSFISKDAVRGVDYDWYYSNGRNHFWPLIEKVYGVDLPDKATKVALFTSLGIGITDIIFKCNRMRGSSLDDALEVLELNPELPNLVRKRLSAVFFTSRYVERLFMKNFSSLVEQYQGTDFIYLPSPSPRYASMSRHDKIKLYKELLPPLQQV